MKTSRVVLLATGVVVFATVAKKWFTPGDTYVPASIESFAEPRPEKP